MPRIRVKDLTVTYVNKKKQEFVALNNFNVEFDDGKINVILGSSGCGKTTLLYAISKQFVFDGHIYFDDVDIDTLNIRKLNLGYVDQNFNLYPKMTVFENIAFPLSSQKLHPDDIKFLVRDIARKLDILPCLNRKPKEISIGQQQRVAIARALVKKPKICLFDEPLSNLDPILANKIRLLLKEVLTDIGCTSIYVTHDYVEAMTLADKVFVMNNSEIEVEGTPSQILENNNEILRYLRESAGK